MLYTLILNSLSNKTVSKMISNKTVSKVIDFEPKKNESSEEELALLNSNLSDSKIGFGKIYFSYVGLDGDSMFSRSSCEGNNALCGIIWNNAIRWESDELFRDMLAESSKKLDLKIDDGKSNSGVVRGLCGLDGLYTSYEDDKKCFSVFYILK